MPGALTCWLAQEKPDVLVVLEVTAIYAQGLQTLAAYPHRHIAAQNNPFGIALLSRHPLAHARTIQDADGIAHIDAKSHLAGAGNPRARGSPDAAHFARLRCQP